MKMGEAHSQHLFSSCDLGLRSGLEDLGVALRLRVGHLEDRSCRMSK